MTPEVMELLLKRQEAALQKLSFDFEAFQKETRDQERKRLLWGVSALGSVAAALAAIIWTQVVGKQ